MEILGSFLAKMASKLDIGWRSRVKDGSESSFYSSKREITSNRGIQNSSIAFSPIAI